jgi:hypothetical protein
MASANPIGDIILTQLGGAKLLRLMIGARDFYSLSEGTGYSGGLQFSLPSNLSRPRINRIIIKLNSRDLYDVEFLSIRRGKDGTYKVKFVALDKDMFNSDLRACIERNTGLVLSLPFKVAS